MQANPESPANPIIGNSSGIKGLVKDWSGDQETFHVPWGKAMMWIFLLSDTFVFSCFFDWLYGGKDLRGRALAECQ